MLLCICALLVITTNVDAKEVISSERSRTNLAKRFVKLLEAEIQSGLTIASTSCKNELMVSKLKVMQETLTEFEFELTDCYTNSKEYTGKRNTTKSGLTCQHWNTIFPHEHAHYNFPDGSVDAAGNYCRDLANHGVPWCLTIDPNTRREDCGVPSCDTFVV
ncbi:hypothetical protein ACJMK2_002359 [Sinanodonta woodiana]|uniref:Kringle domain-containing protein n=1 Tax=Sinanodonta woodiana TaxID=1069815 RepID=A0ABD3XY64_SINWO